MTQERIGPLWDLQHAEAIAPDRVLLRWRDGAWTVGQFGRAARVVADELRRRGVQPGDRVAVMASNSEWHLAVTYGVWLLGGVEVAVNAELRGPLLRHVIEDSEPRVLVVSSRLIELVRAQGRDQLVLVPIEQFDLGDEGLDPAELPPFPHPGDLASLLYTSGTTGPSKGVMIPHGYFSTYADILRGALDLDHDDVCYFALPFFHVDAHIALPTSLRCGSILSFTERFSVRRFWTDVEQFSASWFGAVGSMLSALATGPAPSAKVLNRLRLVLAAPVPEDAFEFFEDRLGVPVLQMYGQTEGNGPIYSTLDSRRRGAMGRAQPHVDVRVADAEGRELPDGTVGALQIRPRQPHVLAHGYWRRPEATEAAFAHEWFDTGDLARRDPDGYWWYAGRATDSVRRRGENVSAFEVESVLRAAPGVTEAAVVAVRDDLGGEDEIKAVLVTDSRFNAHALRDYCARNLPRFARPRFIQLVDEDQLVRGPGTGAIQKHLLPQGVGPETTDLDLVVPPG